MPLLDQRPQVKEFIVEGFDMPKGAWADLRLGFQFKHLGGKRLGPYTLQIRPKGSSVMSPVVLTLCTTYQFLDRNGKRIDPGSDRIFGATDVRETLVSIQLTQARDAEKRAKCP